MGTTQAMLGYTGTIDEEIRGPDFARCERNGVDQGMHNVYIHLGKIRHMKVMEQGVGFVANMQASPAEVLRPGFTVVNQKQQLYAVVHQYDRKPDLTHEYLRRYVKWDRSENGTVCQDYRLSKGGDLLKGQCDLKPAGGVDADMCCKVCDRQEGCQGFALVRGVCFLKSCNGPPGPPTGDSGVTMGLRKSPKAKPR